MTAADDEKAKERVLATLQDGTIEKINFTLGSISVEPSLYRKVSEAIREGKITVMILPELFRNGGPSGHYVNRLKLSEDTEFYDLLIFKSPELQASQTLVVHECTHAGFDLLKIPMSKLENEEAAYVAEAMFMMAKLWQRKIYPEANPGTRSISRAAWDVAMQLYIRPMDRREWWYKEHNANRTALRSAIMQEPEYGPDIGKAKMNHDGVGREWKTPKKK